MSWTRVYNIALYYAFTFLFASCAPTRHFSYLVVKHGIWGFLGPIFLQTLRQNILVIEDTAHVPAFQPVYYSGETSLKRGNKSCLLEWSKKLRVAGCTDREAAKPMNNRWTHSSDRSHTESNRAIDGKRCLQPTITEHGDSSLQVNHRYQLGSARAGYCQNTFRNG